MKLSNTAATNVRVAGNFPATLIAGETRRAAVADAIWVTEGLEVQKSIDHQRRTCKRRSITRESFRGPSKQHICVLAALHEVIPRWHSSMLPGLIQSAACIQISQACRGPQKVVLPISVIKYEVGIKLAHWQQDVGCSWAGYGTWFEIVAVRDIALAPYGRTMFILMICNHC